MVPPQMEELRGYTGSFDIDNLESVESSTMMRFVVPNGAASYGETLRLHYEMRHCRVAPNTFSFTAAFSACGEALHLEARFGTHE